MERRGSKQRAYPSAFWGGGVAQTIDPKYPEYNFQMENIEHNSVVLSI